MDMASTLGPNGEANHTGPITDDSACTSAHNPLPDSFQVEPLSRPCDDPMLDVDIDSHVNATECKRVLQEMIAGKGLYACLDDSVLDQIAHHAAQEVAQVIRIFGIDSPELAHDMVRLALLHHILFSGIPSSMPDDEKGEPAEASGPFEISRLMKIPQEDAMAFGKSHPLDEVWSLPRQQDTNHQGIRAFDNPFLPAVHQNDQGTLCTHPPRFWKEFEGHQKAHTDTVDYATILRARYDWKDDTLFESSSARYTGYFEPNSAKYTGYFKFDPAGHPEYFEFGSARYTGHLESVNRHIYNAVFDGAMEFDKIKLIAAGKDRALEDGDKLGNGWKVALQEHISISSDMPKDEGSPSWKQGEDNPLSRGFLEGTLRALVYSALRKLLKALGYATNSPLVVVPFGIVTFSGHVAATNTTPDLVSVDSRPKIGPELTHTDTGNVHLALRIIPPGLGAVTMAFVICLGLDKRFKQTSVYSVATMGSVIASAALPDAKTWEELRYTVLVVGGNNILGLLSSSIPNFLDSPVLPLFFLVTGVAIDSLLCHLANPHTAITYEAFQNMAILSFSFAALFTILVAKLSWKVTEVPQVNGNWPIQGANAA